MSIYNADNTPETERPSLAPVIAVVMTTTSVIVLSLIILITILVVWFVRRRNKVHDKVCYIKSFVLSTSELYNYYVDHSR